MAGSFAETQTGTKTVPDVVSIQNEGAAAKLVQSFLHCMGERRFARAGQTGKPEHTGFVPVQLFAAGARHRGLVPDDVFRGVAHGLDQKVGAGETAFDSHASL